MLTWVPSINKGGPPAVLELDPKLEIFFAKDLVKYRKVVGGPFTIVAVLDNREEDLVKQSGVAIRKQQFDILGAEG